MTRSETAIIAIVAAILLLFCAYTGSYYAMLKDKVYSPSTRNGSQIGFDYRPIYRVEGRGAEVVYAPAHAIDRLLRPEYWSGTVFDFFMSGGR